MIIPGMKKFFEAEKGGSAPASFENKETVPSDDVISVLHFDPFKKDDKIPDAEETPQKEEAGTKAKAAAGDEKEEKTNLPPAKDDKTSTAKKDASPAKPGDQDSNYWRGLAEAREQELKEARKAKTEPKDTKEEPADKIPEYDFEIPDKLINHLTSDKVEEFKVGVQALAKGIAGAIHAQMRTHMAQSYDPRFASLPQQVIQIVAAHQRNIETMNDFYGTYPELNHPPLKPIIEQIGKDVAKELGKTAWDNELRDAIAERTKLMLSIPSKQNGSAPAAAPKMLPSQGARSAPTPSDKVAREIADTLFSDFN